MIWLSQAKPFRKSSVRSLRTRESVFANDAQIVRSRDAQCNSEESDDGLEKYMYY